MLTNLAKPRSAADDVVEEGEDIRNTRENQRRRRRRRAEIRVWAERAEEEMTR